MPSYTYTYDMIFLQSADSWAVERKAIDIFVNHDCAGRV